jgi:hypothetical protein
VQHTTTASDAPCRHCHRPLIYAWDEGLLVRADATPLDAVVAAELRRAGRRVYALTEGRNLVYETQERAGTLRLVRSRHAEHVCRRRPVAAPRSEQLAIFEVRPPVHRIGGMR